MKQDATEQEKMESDRAMQEGLQVLYYIKNIYFSECSMDSDRVAMSLEAALIILISMTINENKDNFIDQFVSDLKKNLDYLEKVCPEQMQELGKQWKAKFETKLSEHPKMISELDENFVYDDINLSAQKIYQELLNQFDATQPTGAKKVSMTINALLCNLVKDFIVKDSYDSYFEMLKQDIKLSLDAANKVNEENHE